ncbi:hypothetical protein BKA81DRAFT_364898 [Phyllosticta paracitricarpa]
MPTPDTNASQISCKCKMVGMLTEGISKGDNGKISRRRQDTGTAPPTLDTALKRGSRHASVQRRQPSPVSSIRIAADDASWYSPGASGAERRASTGEIKRRVDVQLEATRQTGMFPAHQDGDQVHAGAAALRHFLRHWAAVCVVHASACPSLCGGTLAKILNMPTTNFSFDAV